jgi:hypothetical protein
MTVDNCRNFPCLLSFPSQMWVHPPPGVHHYSLARPGDLQFQALPWALETDNIELS